MMSTAERTPPRLERPHAGETVMHLTGPVDSEFLSDHMATCLAAVEGGKLILNLAGVDHLDSAGLGMLVMLRKRQQLAGGELILRQPQAVVVSLLQTTMLLGHFHIES